jgi:hypothetical protein
VSGAVAALALAQEAGVRLRVDEGRLKVVGRPETVPAELLATLREHKAEVLELLTGHRCRCCGEPIDWRRPGGVRGRRRGACRLLRPGRDYAPARGRSPGGRGCCPHQ